MKTKTSLQNTIKLTYAGALLVLAFFTLGLNLPEKSNKPGPTITVFNAPGAGTASSQGTFPTVINTSGTVAGFTRDANSARHGFLRASNGSFIVFDVPGAGAGDFQGTRVYSVNNNG